MSHWLPHPTVYATIHASKDVSLSELVNICPVLSAVSEAQRSACHQGLSSAFLVQPKTYTQVPIEGPCAT